MRQTLPHFSFCAADSIRPQRGLRSVTEDTTVGSTPGEKGNPPPAPL